MIIALIKLCNFLNLFYRPSTMRLVVKIMRKFNGFDFDFFKGQQQLLRFYFINSIISFGFDLILLYRMKASQR